MKRFVVSILIVLVSLPWAAFPAARATACPMPGAKAIESCAYCAPSGAPTTAAARLQAGCCRFLPNQDSTPAQGSSLGSTPKPIQSPQVAANIPGMPAVGSPLVLSARALGKFAHAPPLASPTRVTHLLL